MTISAHIIRSRPIESPEDLADLKEINGKFVRCGRAWWFWKPRLRWNKGIPWKHAWATFGIQWLCFLWEIDFVR